MMYRLIMAIGVVGATCLALGCGSSSSNGTSASETASAPLTKAQFIKQADAICRKIAKERVAALAAWEKELGLKPTEVEAHADEGLKEVIAPSLRRKAEQLEGLAPPEKDAGTIAKMIESLSKAAETLEQEGKKAVPRSGIADFQREATAYGLKTCPTP